MSAQITYLCILTKTSVLGVSTHEKVVLCHCKRRHKDITNNKPHPHQNKKKKKKKKKQQGHS